MTKAAPKPARAAEPAEFASQDFSATQYYLAHAKNSVHLVLACPQEVSEPAFRAFVARLIEDAPQLGWRESLIDSAHVTDAPVLLDEIIDYARHPLQQTGFAEIDRVLSEPLTDTGRPAFRAFCRTAPRADWRGVRSWIALQTTHALMEGGDVTSILRGRGSVHLERPLVDANLSAAIRLGLPLMMPFLWLFHVLASRSVRLRPQQCSFERVALDRKSLTRAARRLGVGQRALLFGLVTHALLYDPERKRPLSLAYSILPRERVRLYDDEFLNVRIDEFRLRAEDDLEAHIKAMAQALIERGPSPMFSQAWQRRLTGVHKHVHRAWPWLYPKTFFDYTPYDLVLSMLEPVRPERYEPFLGGAHAFAGSNTGASPACIFVPARHEFTLNFWAAPETRERLPRLLEAAGALDIGVEYWPTADGPRVVAAP